MEGKDLLVGVSSWTVEEEGSCLGSAESNYANAVLFKGWIRDVIYGIGFNMNTVLIIIIHLKRVSEE